MSEVFATMTDKPERRLYLDIKEIDLKQLASEVRAARVSAQVILASTKYPIIREWKKLVPESGTLLWMGGTEEALSTVTDGKVYQVGTYNGNPLVMAAARANLTEVMTPDAYAHLDALNDHILAGCREVIARYNLPGYAVGIGSKGCVTFSPTKVVDYESFKANQDGELCDLAWLYNMNRGVFMTPGREEEWTLSITHTLEDCDQFVRVFDEMARDLTS